jgi:hypothetical protein
LDEDDTPSGSYGKIPLMDLFDFTRTQWVKKYEDSGQVSFDRELELYDLVDMDADGIVDDVDSAPVDIDASTQSLFMAGRLYF